MQVGIARPEGCVAWWNKIGAGQTPCPKDCQLSGFKEGYNLGRMLLLCLHCSAATASARPSPSIIATVRPCKLLGMAKWCPPNIGSACVQVGNFKVISLTTWPPLCPECKGVGNDRGNLPVAETGPLYVRVEKGQTSRIAPRPLQGAFLNITGNSRIDNRADYKYQVSDYGVDFVQFSAIKNFGARFTVYMGA